MQLTHSAAVHIERLLNVFSPSKGSSFHMQQERGETRGSFAQTSATSPGGQGNSSRLDTSSPMSPNHSFNDFGLSRSGIGDAPNPHSHSHNTHGGIREGSSSSSSSAGIGSVGSSGSGGAGGSGGGALTTWQKIQQFFCCLKIFLTPCRLVCDACLVPGKSMADTYPAILFYISFSPTYGSGIFLVVYLIFIIVFIPFWLLSYFVTSTGSTVVLICSLVMVCRAFARLMTFPGASKSLQREVSGDYLKRFAVQLHDFAALSAQFAILLASHSITQTQLGVSFNITGDGGRSGASGSGGGSGNGSGIHIAKKASELGRWIEGMKKMHIYLGIAVDEFRQVHSSNFYVDSGYSRDAFTPAHRGSQSFVACIFRPITRFWTLRDNNKRVGNVTINSTAEIAAVVDPVVSVHHVLGTLIICSSVLIAYVNEHIDIYSPNDAASKKSKGKSSAMPSPLSVSNTGNISSPTTTTGANSGAVINSIGLTVRNAEALRASLQYVLERSTNENNLEANGLGPGIVSKIFGSLPSAHGFIRNIMRMGEGPVGPANLSTFIMRAQLLGTYKGRRFTVIGEDGNMIDCITIPGKKDRKDNEERGHKKKKKSKKGHIGSGRSKGKSGGGSASIAALDNNGESDDKEYDSDDTGYTAATNTSSLTAESGRQTGVGGATSQNTSPHATEQASLKKHASGSGASSYSAAGETNREDIGSGSSEYQPSVYGTVLYCGPNAGMYEAFSMVPESSSWLGYYTTTLGMDVVLFNYRGYGMSTGVPSPSRLKSDGVAVYDYVRQVMGATKLIIHGESVGGMVATHIAATDARTPYEAHARTGVHMRAAFGSAHGSADDQDHDLLLGDIEMNLSSSSNPTTRHQQPILNNHDQAIVKALICDRTFASLDAVAGRLLGSWAAAGLWYLGCWYTNSVTDFLSIPGTYNAPSPLNGNSALTNSAPVAASVGSTAAAAFNVGGVMKIIIQDPEDAIVNHNASMQEGVGSVLASGLLGPSRNVSDFNWWPSRIETMYALSLFKAEIPLIPLLGSSTSREEPMLNISDLKRILPPSHDGASTFCACIVTLVQQAQLGREWEDEESDATSLSGTDNSSSLSGRSDLSVVTSTSFYLSIEWMSEYCTQPFNLGQDIEGVGRGVGVGAGNGDNKLSPRRGNALVDVYKGGSHLSFLEKTLAILLRSDNGMGSTLAEVFLRHATAHSAVEAKASTRGKLGIGGRDEGKKECIIFGRGDSVCTNALFEGIRTWLHASLIYTSRSLQSDAKGSDSHHFSYSIAQSYQELRSLFINYGIVTSSGANSATAAATTTGTATATATCTAAAKSNIATDVASLMYTPSKGSNDRTCGQSQSQLLTELNNVLLYILSIYRALSQAQTQAYAQAIAQTQVQVTSPVSPAVAGYLIPVSCGHSGWPAARAITGVTVLLGRAGLDVPLPQSPSLTALDITSTSTSTNTDFASLFMSR